MPRPTTADKLREKFLNDVAPNEATTDTDPTNGNLPVHVDPATMVDAVQRGTKLARVAEHQRRFAYLYREALQLGAIQQLYVKASDHHEDNEPVPDELKRKILDATRAWVHGEGAGS